MSDYEKLNALWLEYITELKRRKVIHPEKWGGYEYPANKERLHRLRLEINNVMLKMERQMNPSHARETWY